jgi:NADH-quinone oxidoreductase subunit M
MILLWLILVPLLGGILAWMLGRRLPPAARWVSLMAMLLELILSVQLWREHVDHVSLFEQGNWFKAFTWPWVPQYGINLYLAMDGLSLLMVVLTAVLGVIAVIASWSEIQERLGFFHFNLLWVLAGVTGVFLSLDLFLFYFFWEMMLIPMYFLIGIWGHEHRIYASTKFFIFTQASGLLMLLAILGLYFVHYRTTGIYTFKYDELLGTAMAPRVAMLLMLGFFVAFAVKLPAFPFHPWLPDAHTEAPTAGSVVLAGVLLKTGAYGLIRFVVPLFHDAAVQFAPIGMTLGVIGIVYGAMLAFGQNDLKRLVAYTSVSHLGFVMVGVFAWNTLALQGVIMQMICHGFSTGSLFVLVGTMQERIHTRDMREMGGMWETVPRMGAIGMFFALASMGLPGLGSFVAEFLILVGSYQVSPVLTIIAAVGLIAATVYSLWIIHRTFYGEKHREWRIPDLSFRHLLVFGAMMIALLWLGLFPQTVLDTAKPALDRLESSASLVPNAPAPQPVPTVDLGRSRQ